MNNILHITMDDIDEVIQLHNEYLNYGEGIKPHFENVLLNNNNVCLKFVLNKKIEGLIVATEGIVLSGGHEDICEKIHSIVGDNKTYTGDAVLIRSNSRHHGIFEKLCDELYKELKEKGVRYIVAELWRYPNGKVPAHNIIKFYKSSLFLGTYKDFYKDFYKSGYICPICGIDCVCSADLYLNEL